MLAMNFFALICYLFLPIIPFSTRAALQKMDEWKKTNNILEKKVHGVQRDLEDARRERGLALRRVKALEAECKDLQELLCAMDEREVILTLPYCGFVHFYSSF